MIIKRAGRSRSDNAEMARHSIRWARTALTAAAAFLVCACASWPPTPSSRRDVPLTFATALAKGLPSSVGVYGVSPHSSSDDAPADVDVSGTALAHDAPAWLNAVTPARIGAGFFLSSDGLVVTAAHILADAEQIVVSLPDQRVVRATLLGADGETDIALLRVPVTPHAVPPIGSSRGLRAGDWVLAIGEPYGLDRAVVAGIVGGPGRHFPEDAALLYIQSDLPLNPGNSGGPLLDMQGNIVAMNLRTIIGSYGAPGLSLSVPIEIVQQIAAQLAERGRVARLRLGAVFEDVSPLAAFAAGRSHATGALVSDVTKASLAERMGLRTGDIVVGMNGQPIGDSADLVRVLLDWTELEHTRLTIFRGGRYEHLRLTTQAWHPAESVVPGRP